MRTSIGPEGAARRRWRGGAVAAAPTASARRSVTRALELARGDDERISAGDDGDRAAGRSLPKCGEEPGRGGSEEGIGPVGTRGAEDLRLVAAHLALFAPRLRAGSNPKPLPHLPV
jgi:hypothetical protein